MNNLSKLLIGIILAVVIVGGGFYAFGGNSELFKGNFFAIQEIQPTINLGEQTNDDTHMKEGEFEPNPSVDRENFNMINNNVIDNDQPQDRIDQDNIIVNKPVELNDDYQNNYNPYDFAGDISEQNRIYGTDEEPVRSLNPLPEVEEPKGPSIYVPTIIDPAGIPEVISQSYNKTINFFNYPTTIDIQEIARFKIKAHNQDVTIARISGHATTKNIELESNQKYGSYVVSYDSNCNSSRLANRDWSYTNVVALPGNNSTANNKYIYIDLDTPITIAANNETCFAIEADMHNPFPNNPQAKHEVTFNLTSDNTDNGPETLQSLSQKAANFVYAVTKGSIKDSIWYTSTNLKGLPSAIFTSHN